MSVLSGPLQPLHGFGVVLRNADTILIACKEVQLSGRIVLRCRSLEPHDRFSIVLRNANAVGIHAADNELGLDVPLVRESEQFFRAFLVYGFGRDFDFLKNNLLIEKVFGESSMHGGGAEEDRHREKHERDSAADHAAPKAPCACPLNSRAISEKCQDGLTHGPCTPAFAGVTLLVLPEMLKRKKGGEP